MRSIIIIIVATLISFSSWSQEVITYQEFLAIILQEHPLAQQADLQFELAEIETLKARGVLDPKFATEFNQKQFDDKNYFDLIKSEIKIPTILGLSVKGNFETNDGEFLNPQNFTTNQGLWSAGVEMDVLRNWVYNDRRAAFDSAEIYQNQTTNKRLLLLNKLVKDATTAYINWFIADRNVEIIQNNIELAQAYVDNTTISVEFGDKPAIDTIEAQTILFDQLIAYQELEIERVKAKFSVNSFLWDDQQILFLGRDTEPARPNFMIAQELLNFDFFETHPEVIEQLLQANQFNIQGKLAKQNLLPELSLGYFPLISTNENSFLPADTQVSNYKIGARFSMPLFRRKERANLQVNRVYEQTEILEAKNITGALQIKWNQQFQQLQTLNEQISLLEKAERNYQQLVDAELIRYDYGESSVFLVNKRLEKLLETQLKLQTLRKKRFQTQVEQLYLLNDLLPN